MVPELPQSSIPSGSLRPSSPRPLILTVLPFSIGLISTPISLRQAAVHNGSSAGRMPSIVVVPSAIPPSSSALCEMDLSPGTRTLPDNRPPARSNFADDFLLGTFKKDHSFKLDFIGDGL